MIGCPASRTFSRASFPRGYGLSGGAVPPFEARARPRPPDEAPVSDAASHDRHPLGDQQRSLHRRIAAVAAEPASSRDHPVPRRTGSTGLARDVAHRAGCPRPSRERRDVAVGGCPARRDAADGVQHSRGEGRCRHGCTPAQNSIRAPNVTCTPPRGTVDGSVEATSVVEACEQRSSPPRRGFARLAADVGPVRRRISSPRRPSTPARRRARRRSRTRRGRVRPGASPPSPSRTSRWTAAAA